MKTLAAAFALAAILPLAGCSSSPGAWAYYDHKYDYGQESYQRPITYQVASQATYYGEAVPNRPYGNLNATPQPQTYERTTETPDYAGELNASSRHPCACSRSTSRQGNAPAHDPSWNSTYYAIGP